MNLHSRFFNKFRDIPLKHKLFICIMFFIILPLIITGIFMNNQFVNISIKKSCETSLQILKQTRQSFEDMITDANDLSINILKNDNVQRFARTEPDNLESNKLYTDISGWLDDVIGSKEYFDSICLFKENEIILQKGRLISNDDPSYIENAVRLKGRGYWTGVPNADSSSGTRTEISFFRSIIDFNMIDRTLAVQRISINEDTLCGFYSNINPYENGNMFLVDKKGLVLSSPDKKAIGSDYSHFEYVKRVLREKEGFFLTKIGDKKSIVLYYTMTEPDWHLIETIPLDSFIPAKTNVNAVLVITVLLCILFGILFSIIQNKYLVKPLSKLLKEMNKLKIGNFNVNLNTKRQDEIGEINKGFTEMASQLKETINDVYIGKIKQREAELHALEAQINPHFLYNTLDSIRWLAVKNRNYDISEQIEALSEIFKHVLNKGNEIVTLKEEIEFLNDYMFIQNAKYGDRIVLNIHVDSRLLDLKMPKLIIQPLVENSIIHGLEQKIEGGTIEINIERDGELLRFSVSDDGNGIDENKIRKMLTSKEHSVNIFALKNIDERIKLKYGESFGLSFHSQTGCGTRVEVLLPAVD